MQAAPEDDEARRCCACGVSAVTDKVFTLFDGEGTCFHGREGVLVMLFSDSLVRSGPPVREPSSRSGKDARAWSCVGATHAMGCEVPAQLQLPDPAASVAGTLSRGSVTAAARALQRPVEGRVGGRLP